MDRLPITPDNDRLRKALFRDGEPDRVPMYEQSIDQVQKARFFGREIASYRDDFEFWAAAGYDHVVLNAGMRFLIRSARAPGMFTEGEAEDLQARSNIDVSKLFVRKRDRYAYDGGITEREWAPEGDGLIATMEEFRRFPWPSATDFDYTPFELAENDLPEGVRVTAVLGWNFTGAWWLMGMERFLLSVRDQPELVAALIQRVSEIQHEVLLHLLREHRACLGAVAVPDDIAYVGGLMVSPELLRAHLFPGYRELCSECHRAELPVIYHSDGKLDEVIPDVIECGFDGLHPIESQAMDIRALKRRCGDKLCLLGNLDLAYPLGLGTPEDVRAEVKSLIEDCAGGGGYCIGSGSCIPEYVPYENWTALREASFEFGRYPLPA